jgi:putative sterol carrier protein
MANESFIKLRKLTVRDDEPIEDIVKRGADELRKVGATATVEIRLIDARGTKARTSFTVEHTPAGTSVHPRSAQKPDFVVITTHEAFRRMAGGTYSPFQAFLNGDLKVHGNAEIGRQIVRHLSPAGGGGSTCNPMLYNESYNPAGPDGGSLTLSGCCFTPNGTVLLNYDFGSGAFESPISADANGQFLNFLQPGIGCGDIPNHPGVGVIVTATDLATGKSTTQGYATPC